MTDVLVHSARDERLMCVEFPAQVMPSFALFARKPRRVDSEVELVAAVEEAVKQSPIGECRVWCL